MLIDVNCSLGNWPFMRFAQDTPAKLAKHLAAEGVKVRLVSFPSWELFAEQDAAYQNEVLPPEITARISVEAGITLGWERWVGPQGGSIGLDRFGASAPQKVLYQKFGFTAENVVKKAKELLKN